MKKSITLMLMCTLGLLACDFEKKVLNEPERSYLMTQCLMSQRSITECLCLEQEAIEKSGVSVISENDKANSEKFLQALQTVINLKSCTPVGK